MTPEQEAHLKGLTDRFVSFVDRKYRAGQKEHGGDLWKKKDIIGMAKEEVADLWVYLDTLEQQINESGVDTA